MKKIGRDKWKHFYVGIAMGMVLQIMSWWFLPGRLMLEVLITFLIVVAISYGFELFSLITGKGHHEVMDAVAAIIGGILGMAAVLAIQFLK